MSEIDEAKLLQLALKTVTTDCATTGDPTLQELRDTVEKTNPGLLERIKRDGLPTLEECFVFLRASYELGKQAHALATKAGWIGVKK